jgi:hypothetical protein
MSDQAEGQNEGGQRDGKEARKVMGVEEMDMGKVGEDSLPWIIIMLLSFLPRGMPLH